MSPEIQKKIEAAFQQQQEDRWVWQLTEALVYALNIPQDRSLVLWLTDQPARNNREAVKYWIRQKLHRLKYSQKDEVLPMLRRELQLQLFAIQEGI